jgi:release factor glutamine methyltransferase
LEAVVGNLTTPFRAEVFDAVVFNPPYLPAMEAAEWDDWFEVAVTGGATGRELVERFLDGVGRVLVPDGRGYLLVSSLTGVEAVVEYAANRGFSAVALADATFPGETLTVLKLVR